MKETILRFTHNKAFTAIPGVALTVKQDGILALDTKMYRIVFPHGKLILGYFNWHGAYHNYYHHINFFA